MATLAEKDTLIADLTAKLTSAQRLAADKTESLETAFSNAATAEAARALAVQQLETERTAHTKTRAELDNTRDEVAGAGQVITELNEALSAAQEASPADAAKPRTVKHDGQAYVVTHLRFRFQDKVHDAADVTEGSALLAELVRVGAGVLSPAE